MEKIHVFDGEEDRIPTFSFIVAGNGFFLKKETNLIKSITPVSEVPLPSLQTEIEVKVKIPYSEIKKCISFFRSVVFSDQLMESICQIFYNIKTKKCEIEIPTQFVESASISYKPAFKQGYINIGTIHSHGIMTAFHSSTDKEDESNKEGIHFVVGNIDSDWLTITCVLSSNGSRIKVKPEDYITGVKFSNGRIYIGTTPKIRSFKDRVRLKSEELRDTKICIPDLKTLRQIDYLDIVGLKVEELRLLRDLTISPNYFITIYDQLDEDEAEKENQNRFTFLVFGGGEECWRSMLSESGELVRF